MNSYSKIYNQEIQYNEDYIYDHSIKINKLWDEQLVNLIIDYIEPDTDIIDIGANIGLITLGVKQKMSTDNNHFHLFECHNEIFSFLKFNTKNHTNISLYQLAVSDKIQLCNMSFHKNNNGASFVSKTSTDNITHKNFEQYIEMWEKEHNIFIPSLSLDFLIDLNLFERKISVVKIDIEGFEYQALLGMKKLLEIHRPVIFVEIFLEYKEKIHNLLISYNYTLDSNLGEQDFIYLPL